MPPAIGLPAGKSAHIENRDETMTDSAMPQDTPISDATRQRLEGVRRALLHLHKGLLEVERGAYEKVYGRLASGAELLQLVIQHPWFAWLRPVSEIVVRIDEMLDAKAEEPVTERDAAALLQQVRSLLRPAEGSGNEEFSRRYQQALQQDPGIILAHAEVIRNLPPPPLGSPPAQ